MHLPSVGESPGDTLRMYTSDEDRSGRTLGEDTFTFEVEAGDLDRIRLDTAFMLSRRGRPIAARFTLDRETGLLQARIPHEGGRVTTAAIILQATLPQIGELKLSTTQLPPREQPYDLMLELARERLRQYLQKCEDWQMFAPTVAPEALACFNEARELLSQAVWRPIALVRWRSRGSRSSRRSRRGRCSRHGGPISCFIIATTIRAPRPPRSDFGSIRTGGPPRRFPMSSPSSVWR